MEDPSGPAVPWVLRKTISALYRCHKKVSSLSPFIPKQSGQVKPHPFSLSAFVSKQVKEMSYLFIVGEDLDSAWPALSHLRKEGFCFTLDLLGEAVLSEKKLRSIKIATCKLSIN